MGHGGDCAQLNVAAAVTGPFMITTQVGDVPEQPCFHPLKTAPVAGTAVSVTFVPVAKLALHDDPHDTPAGDDVTVPLPLPLSTTVRVCEAAGWNVALTDMFADMVTVHVDAVPAQPPAHPANTEPVAGDAVSVTVVPEGKPAVHALPQLMPLGLDDTDPPPAPPFVSASWYDAAAVLKTAAADVAA